MNTENNNNNAIEQRFIGPESVPVENAGLSAFETIAGILKRWYIVMPIFILVTAIAIPAIWLLNKPLYTVQGAIRVAPIMENILSGEDDKGGIGSVGTFMNTQARMITSSQVCERVADELDDKNLKFFTGGAFDPETYLKEKLKGVRTKLTPVQILKQAVTNGVISAVPAKNSQLIMVTMTFGDEHEARQIVDAFIRAYMAVEVSASTQGENRTLSILENEHKLLAKKLKSQREKISALAHEFGSKALESRQEMKLDQVAMLLNKVTEHEASVLQMEAQVEVLKKRIMLMESGEILNDPNKMDFVADLDDSARNEYINSDASVESLSSELTLYKRMLMELSLDLTPVNPQYQRKMKVLAQLQAEVDDRKEEVGEKYDSMKAKRLSWESKVEITNAKNMLARAESELELQKAMELRFREKLAEADTATIAVGRTQLNIEDLEDELALTREQYDEISRRIHEIGMERKRPTRITVAFKADTVIKSDKRIKLSLASVFGGLALGIGLAFLRTKADKRLHKPADISRSIDLRVIGTTTSMAGVKKSLMPGKIAEDFQTIRANLSVLNGNGGITPGKLVITSPGPGEGKTTLAINLATSMAKTGKRVLLIDGDMRSPSIANLLDLPKASRGLQDVLFGADYKEVVCSMPSGLDVLACDNRNSDDAFELLASPITVQYINAVAKNYNHVIIDTPPLLAFPDAMIWAKMSDAVVLSCFIGKTTTANVKLAKERLSQIDTNLLGTILGNVPSDEGYYRYGYSGYSKNIKRNKVESQLIPMHKIDDDEIESIGFDEKPQQ